MAGVKSHEIVLLLFDISSLKSFEWVASRASIIASTKKSVPPSVALIGTKLDLDHKREVEYDQAYMLADRFKWQYIEISTADQSLADLVSYSKSIPRFIKHFQTNMNLVRSIITEFITFKKYTSPKRRSSVQNLIHGTFKSLTSMLNRGRRATELPTI